jgi:transposase-like protein
MIDESMAMVEYLRNLGAEDDFFREAARVLAQAVIEAEANEKIGAERYERTPERRNQRNGYRSRMLETRVGELHLQIPKVRTGTFFPSLLEPRKRSEKALLSTIQSAYVQGVSTRKVDRLLQSLGLTGIDKSRVSRICKELDKLVVAFRQRSFEATYPYLWLDALYLKVRQNHRIVNMALVIAIGVRETGEREILDFEMGASEEFAFWQAFLRQLVARGLKGVLLATSDAHNGLKKAVAEVFPGAAWQRCRVHFMRNILAHIPKGDKSMVAVALRTIFTQPSREAAGEQLSVVVGAMETRWPRAAEILADAEADVLAFMAFPKEHWTRVYSTNPLERLNKEVKRRTNVVGIFPDVPSVLRLVGSILVETDEEWQIGRRYFSLNSMQKLRSPELNQISTGAPMRLAPVR